MQHGMSVYIGRIEDMAESYSTTSLDYWRKFFSSANADIFQVIKYAILVAATNCPSEFLSCRDQITEILYTCWPMECSSDQDELQTPDGVEDDVSSEDTHKESEENKSTESVENGILTSNEQSSSSRLEYSNLDEFEALNDEIEEEQQAVGEVLRIKGMLRNWREESEKVLAESLRRLQLMELPVDILTATDIGRAVSSLYKHKSKTIRQTVQTLVEGWKLLADEWVSVVVASQETSPNSVDPSPTKESPITFDPPQAKAGLDVIDPSQANEEPFLPSELDFPPLDVGALLATQTASFEFSEFFEGMDDDGNMTNTRELKRNGRNTQQKNNKPERKENVDIRKHEFPNPSKPIDVSCKASKSKESACSVLERPSKSATERNSQLRKKMGEDYREVRKQEIVPKATKPIDATSKTQDIPRTQVLRRPTARATTSRNPRQRQKSSEVPSKSCLTSENVPKELEELSYRDKLEAAKRKLQDRYQEAKDAKRQRTIQVMELKDLPKQSLNRQQLKMKRGTFFKRHVNLKS